MSEVSYDRELIARMLEAGYIYGALEIAEQARLLRAADNRDAANVGTTALATPPAAPDGAMDDGSVDYARTKAYAWLDERDRRMSAALTGDKS